MNSAVTSGAVRIRRDSDANSDAPYVDFVNGSVLTETDLDKAYRHNLYLNEEIGNLNEQSLQKKVGDDTKWDAQSQPIVNITDPNLVQSAATKNYVDTQISNQITGSSTESSVYSFTGNGSSTAFTFSPAISLGSDTMYEVAIDGVLQTPTTAYAIDADANTITFTSAPPSSASIVVVQRGYAVPVATGSSYTHPNHTGDVTSAGDGATTIADNAVTSAKIAANDNVFLVDGASTQKQVVINNAVADVDFVVKSSGNGNLIITDGANNTVGIGTLGTTGISCTAGSLASGFLILYNADTSTQYEGGQVNIHKAGINTPSASGGTTDSFIIDTYKTNTGGNYGLSNDVNLLRIVGTSAQGGSAEKSIIIDENANLISSGTVKATQLNINPPVYADDSAAGTGGLVAGDVYKTSAGELRIKL